MTANSLNLDCVSEETGVLKDKDDFKGGLVANNHLLETNIEDVLIAFVSELEAVVLEHVEDLALESAAAPCKVDVAAHTKLHNSKALHNTILEES